MFNMKGSLFLSVLWLASVIASSPEENLHTRDDELIEGDIKLLPGQITRGSVTTKLWPGGVFVYDIESSLDDPTAKERIALAMDDWTQLTDGCITFVKRTTETAYVSMFKGSGCWSYLGRTGSKQQLSLGSGCWGKGTIIHEIGHALGFLHEQSRPDRDDYVEIKFENIQSGKEGNFAISNSVNSLGTPYDYGSIMHYGEKYFSKNGQPTIVPKTSGVTIGNREGLSDIDKAQMKLLYNCHGTFKTCDFEEDFCGFEQATNDAFNWTRNSGKTSSGYTGPTNDHTSGSGYYAYIETSTPRQPGDIAKISRTVTLSGNSCLRFYYHMYGANIGYLKVRLDDELIFEKSGNQGNEWKMQEIPLQGSCFKELTFEAMRGGHFRGDAAIDDIKIYEC